MTESHGRIRFSVWQNIRPLTIANCYCGFLLGCGAGPLIQFSQEKWGTAMFRVLILLGCFSLICFNSIGWAKEKGNCITNSVLGAPYCAGQEVLSVEYHTKQRADITMPVDVGVPKAIGKIIQFPGGQGSSFATLELNNGKKITVKLKTLRRVKDGPQHGGVLKTPTESNVLNHGELVIDSETGIIGTIVKFFEEGWTVVKDSSSKRLYVTNISNLFVPNPQQFTKKPELAGKDQAERKDAKDKGTIQERYFLEASGAVSPSKVVSSGIKAN
jgi:hypothetical protein